MKYSAMAALALIALFASDALASCPTPARGLYSYAGITWYDYTPDSSCVSPSGNVSSTTLACGDSGYEFGSGYYNDVTYSFTPEDGKVLTEWQVDMSIDFDDPNNNWFNQISAYVTVTHNGSPTTTYIITHDGTQGSLSSCNWPSATFAAAAGDTVEVTVNGQKFYTNTTIKSSFPRIFTVSP